VLLAALLFVVGFWLPTALRLRILRSPTARAVSAAVGIFLALYLPQMIAGLEPVFLFARDRGSVAASSLPLLLSLSSAVLVALFTFLPDFLKASRMVELAPMPPERLVS
jgi:predicted anti-sigma-YlaC factor YlaD